MALTEAEIQARITVIRKARDSGVLSVRHGDTSTTFRDLKEMTEILADLEGQLARAQGVTKSRVRYVIQSDRGY